MQLTVPPPEYAKLGLRAIKGVAIADGEFHPLERQLIDGAQRHVLHTDFDLDALTPIADAELEQVPPGEFRERIFNAALIVALIDGEASAAEVAELDRIATVFGLESRALEDVRRLTHGCMNIFRLDILRRGFSGQRIQNYLKIRGLSGAATILRAVAHREDAALAAKYYALAELPANTLGRQYHDFIRANDFDFPGEKNGAPEPIVFHDCLHVLGGYGTSAIEEGEILAFQAGMITKDPVYTFMFALAQFHLGIAVSPVTDPLKMQLDPESLTRGMVRGSKVNRDLCVDWQPWDDFERDVDELRAQFEIAPR
ncbi:MAG: hypothetical protein VB934_04140 [Polyangiaceae bacterium]